MSDSPVGSARDGDARLGRASVDELLDQAVAAINRGDHAAAAALAGHVLAVDSGNVDAEDLLCAPGSGGEIRRLTILFADLVDSTVLSTRVEPETYRLLVGRYREQVLRIVNRYEGHIGSTKGDGLLAVFGHPNAHENDVRRAVQAGLEITREVARLSEQAQRRFGIEMHVRVGVHRGLVYLDTAQDDVYGLAANLAARVSGLAPSDAVVVSDVVAALVRKDFELEARPAAAVKGVEEPITHCRVVSERSPAARVGRGPVVGRDRELSRLEKCWKRAQAGTLTTPGVVFRGEPGIGKSRLATAAAELVQGSGAVVLELLGSPFHTDAGLHPVRGLIERRCGVGPSTVQGQRLRLLEAEVRARGLDPTTVVPLLAPVLAIGAEAGYEPAPAEGRKLHELIGNAVRDYLLACVAGAGLVVAEDVHWFDPSTTEVLSSLLDTAAGRLLVVVTGRLGEWLPASWPVKVFDLQPLTDEQTDELITALDPNLSADDRASVARRCDGMPFYIGQVVAGLSESGVPEALYEPLFARLRASSNAVPVVEAAAVIGRDVDHDLLCAVVDLSDDEVDDVLDELEDALVMEPSGTDSWRFRHELLREVAAELAPPSVARLLHARVAEALVDRGDGDPDWRLVAGHYDQAERFDESAAAYKHAAAQARQRGALAEARSYLTHALAQLDRTKAGPGRDRGKISLLLRRGFLAWAAGGVGSYEGAADFQRCLQLGGTELRDDELFALLVALSGHYAARADLQRVAKVGELLREGVEHGRPWSRPIIEAQFGALAWLRGEFDAARCHLEEAAGAHLADHQVTVVSFIPSDPIDNAHLHLALIRMLDGDHIGAEAEVTLVLQRVKQVGFPQGPYSHVSGRFVQAWICYEAGQLERAALLATDLINQADQHGLDQWQLAGTALQASVTAVAALNANPVDPTGLSSHIATLTMFVDTARSLELTIYLTFFDGVLARLLTAAGQRAQARDRLDTALRLARNTGMHFYDAELLRLRAHTQIDPIARQADITAALAVSRRQGATLFELRAALDDYELRGPIARAALIDAASHIPNNNAWPELARAQAGLPEHSPET